ncbi:uncharacterized protein LOC105686533 isoform X2 [Athalia rosae]|nr:uncharacterized protein LOC105686533 isoform X2 [Athalia rosae]
MNIQLTSLEKVSPQLFKSCLIYTIYHKLAPEWNQLGEDLIQGRNFLTSESPLNAVRMEITNQSHIKCEETIFSISPRCYRSFVLFSLQNLKGRDQFLPTKIINDFLAAKNDTIEINERTTGKCLVQVFPSLRRARVVRITKQMSKTHFKHYDQIRNYWQNMYAYHLPESDNDLIYYEICFFGESFTYPSCCVLAPKLKELRIFPAKDIVNQFISDLHTRVPTICGVPLTVTKFVPSTFTVTLHRRDDLKENVLINERAFPTSQRLTLFGSHNSTCDLENAHANPYCGSSAAISNTTCGSTTYHNVMQKKDSRQACDLKDSTNAHSSKKTCLGLSDSNNTVDTVIKTPKNIIDITLDSWKKQAACLRQLPNDSLWVGNSITDKLQKSDSNDKLAVEQSGKDNNVVTDGPHGNATDITSPYFDVIPSTKGNEYLGTSGARLQVKISSQEGKKSTKLNFHRLSRKKLTTPMIIGANAKRKDQHTSNLNMKDISEYFKTKKRVGKSFLETSKLKSDAPKFIQTQLNLQHIGMAKNHLGDIARPSSS